MQKQGTITTIMPTPAPGGYQSQNGWIYTFMLTIQCQDGVHSGEIGTKTQNFPMNTGEQITVEMTQGQYGPRFKKINPQYAGQDGAPQPQQQPSQPRQQPNTKPRDYDAENRGKCRSLALCAMIAAGIQPDYNLCDKYVEYMMKGQHFDEDGEIPEFISKPQPQNEDIQY